MKITALSCRYLLLAGILFLFGCGGADRSLDERGWPTKLVYAFWVDDEVPGLRLDSSKYLADYLSERLGLEIVLKKSTQYGPVIEAMRSRKADISRYGTFSYLLAAAKAGAECIAIREYSGRDVSYHSLILTRKESGIKNLDDLKSRGSETTFAFTNPASTSGHLIPRAYLEIQDIFPERDFKELVFPGKHNATILSIQSGKVDVGCVSENTYRKLVKLGKVDPEELVVVWKSPPIPDGCIAVREGLPQDLKDAIRRAIVDLPEEDPEAWEKVKDIHRFSAFPDSVYRAATDSHYDEIRKIAARIDNLEMLK